MPEYNLGKVVGTDGKGIADISKTDTTDNVDTYTITYTNGDETTFTVTNAETVDSITNGDMRAVTSNAVYDAIGNIQEYVNR
jgi:hypothetical protein